MLTQNGDPTRRKSTLTQLDENQQSLHQLPYRLHNREEPSRIAVEFFKTVILFQ